MPCQNISQRAMTPSIVLDIPFGQIGSKPFCLAHVKARRFRFIDCQKLAQKQGLKVLEYHRLPTNNYAAVSYPWNDLRASANTTSISVNGTNGAQPISAAVLRSACLAALKHGAALLWVDALCIMQTDADDKNWQIRRMYSIYSSCKMCLIVPGGLARLAAVHERTSWIHRAWTLQECFASPQVYCLFGWKFGDSTFGCIGVNAKVEEVEPGTAAIIPFKSLIELSMGAHTPAETGYSRLKLLGTREKDEFQLLSLLGTLDYRGKVGMGNAVWRSAMARVASRPVDKILSIMGIFGVDLDPANFEKDDFAKAAVALMQALLQKGEMAEWLCIAPQLGISSDISMLPAAPRPSAEGRAVHVTQDGREVELDEITKDPLWTTWYLRSAPGGSMADCGCFDMNARVIPMEPSCCTEHSCFKTVSGKEWRFVSNRDSPYVAVSLGERETYSNGRLAVAQCHRNNAVMLLERDGSKRCNVIDYSFVSGNVFEVHSQDWKWEIITIAGHYWR